MAAQSYMQRRNPLRDLATVAASGVVTAAGDNLQAVLDALALEGGGGSIIVQEEGSDLTERSKINFVGAGLTASDDAGNSRTNVTVATLLNAIAGLTGAADRLPYLTGTTTAALATFAASARALLAVTAATDALPYFTSSSAAAVTTLTAFMRTLLDDTTAAAARTTLGLGNLVLSGGFFPSPPATLYATVDIRPGGSTPAEGWEVWDFDDTTVEYLDLIGTMSRHFGSQALKLRLPWTATSATSGNVKWQAGFRRFDAAHDVDGSKTYTYQSATTAVPGTNGYTAYTDIDFTAAQIDGVVAGEQFCVRIRRDTSVGSNATGDAELWVPGVQLVEV